MLLNLPSPVQEISSPLLESKNIRLYIKREDLIHPVIGGNKWRKLKYNLEAISRKKIKLVLSFGGAYSNHIYALAGSGELFGFDTIGIIRGEETLPLNSTLSFAKQAGMKLHYVSRKDYRLKDSPEFTDKLLAQFGEIAILPEGGSNRLALRGCAEIIDELESQLNGEYDTVCLPCGTGGTLAGLVSSGTRKNILGFAVLKGAGFLQDAVDNLLLNETSNTPTTPAKNWTINLDYHFNGYAKQTPELLNFIDDFWQQYNIPLESVYSGKMFYGLFDLIKNNYFPEGARIVALHTGGIRVNLS